MSSAQLHFSYELRTQRRMVHIGRHRAADSLAREDEPFSRDRDPYNGDDETASAARATAARADQAHQPNDALAAMRWRSPGLLHEGSRSLPREIFTSGSANQPLDDTHDLPKVSPPTPTVRTKRALRSAPIEHSVPRL
jgi:hypothetical protein